MVFCTGGDEGHSTKENVSSLCDAIRNPYYNIYHWAKGELFDIEAVSLQLSTRDKSRFSIGKNEKKKMQNQENLDNVQAGRKTLKTMFKNKDDAGKMVNNIESVSSLYLFSNLVWRIGW